ncbi:MAG: hypothetical protein SOX71_06035 [Candidatus Faecousia sp.]|nr:hypothetical protein [Candidatus Faecousia sp.]
MKCLKCGRETDQTFCESCREDMARYPVKPGTIVQLPKDRASSSPRDNRSWHNGISMEEQIAGQKRTIRRLSRVIAVLALLLLGMGVTMFLLLRGGAQPKPGQNYSAVTKPTEDPTVPTTGPDSSS